MFFMPHLCISYNGKTDILKILCVWTYIFMSFNMVLCQEWMVQFSILPLQVFTFARLKKAMYRLKILAFHLGLYQTAAGSAGGWVEWIRHRLYCSERLSNFYLYFFMANITSGFASLKAELKFCSRWGSDRSGAERGRWGRGSLLLGEGWCWLLLRLGIAAPTTVSHML